MVTGGPILNAIRDIHRIQDGDAVDQDAFIRLTGLLYDIYNTGDILESDALRDRWIASWNFISAGSVVVALLPVIIFFFHKQLI